MAELADEAETLQANVESLVELDAALETFNEGFASFLYVLKMNACCIEWLQAPKDNSFALARRRALEAAARTQEALARAAAATPNKTANTTIMPDGTDTTFSTVADKTPGKESADGSKPTLKPALKKRVAKPKMTAKEKRERDAAIEAAVSLMPLEFRGGDINLRRVVDKLIGALMDADHPQPLASFVKPPELTQAKVNKCMIALVNSKLVAKTVGPNKAGVFAWRGPAS